MNGITGRLTSVALLALGAPAAAETLSYSYDAHGRLIEVQRSGGPNTGIGTRHSYDAGDNRSSVWIGAGTPPSPPAQRAPAFTVGDAALPESHILAFTVSRHGSINGSFSVNYATADGTAAAGSDYVAASGTLSFGPDDFSRTVSVETSYDLTFEPDETFFFNLSSPSGGATLSDAQGVGTIVNDDPSNYPPIGVADYSSSATCLPDGKVINVTGNDTDPEGNYPITLIGIDSVSGGAGATVENATSLRFYPGAPATANVTYRIQDSLGAQGTGTLQVTVSGSACP